MVKLSDYVGLMLSEMTKARVDADVEALRVAEVYGEHDLFKTFPIPRVRIKNVEVTMPVMVGSVNEKELEAYKRPLDMAEINRHVNSVVRSVLAKRGLTVAAEENRRLKTTISDTSKAIRTRYAPQVEEKSGKTTMAMMDTLRFSANYAAEVSKRVAVSSKGVDAAKLEAELRDEINARLIRIKPEPPKLNVEVSSAKIMEAANPQSVTYLKFSLVEEGMEWTKYESAEGEQKRRLVPE